MVDFIGLGAQKAGTSWIYACLYEHPEICAPFKEIHFFSRERFSKGIHWYEDHWSRCEPGTKKGEFSTSYLCSKESAERINRLYPDTKLIAVVRHPIKRAYSDYYNLKKIGRLPAEMKFSAYAKKHPEVLTQGLYADQLYHYLQYTSTKQLLIMVYEDIEKDPAAFMKQIYEHIGVDPDFSPTMLHNKVNVGRIPSSVRMERWMIKTSEILRRLYLDKLVWLIRKSGVPDYLRTLNTKQLAYSHEATELDADVEKLKKYFRSDVEKLSQLLSRNLTVEWGINDDEAVDEEKNS